MTDYPEDILEIDEVSDLAVSHMIPSKMYDLLKFLVQLLIPGLATLYFALANLWNLPAAEEVVGTSAAVAAFLGLFIRASARSYEKSGAAYDGTLVVSKSDEGNILYSLEFNGDIDKVPQMNDIRFKVQ